MKKRRVATAAAIVAAAAGVALYSRITGAIPVDAYRVRAGPVEEIITAVSAGTVKSPLEAVLSPETGGRVSEVRVREGSAVRKGELLARIAAISLPVGWIGIMNIMLVTVPERTNGIGIRKAVGARERDILLQFILESVTLSAVGGFCGVLAGLAGAGTLRLLAPKVPVSVPAWAVLLAFAFSAIVGVFFGAYPARKAASLNPIEALRYE